MKINTRALTISIAILFGTFILIMSIWSRLSTQFGHDFMDVFHSIHPHPFRSALVSLSWDQQVYGTALDVFYAVIDSVIFGLGFGLLYNWFLPKTPED